MRVQKWLQACKKAKSRVLVEDSYLEFLDLIWSLALKLFFTLLPASVSNPKDNIDNSHREPSKKQNRNNKEKSEKEQVKKTLVKNPTPHLDLLLKDRDD